MHSILQRQLKNLPTKPGIYEFFDAKNKLLYVGKAKSLKPRVLSYFHKNADLSPAKQLMVRQIHHVQTTEVTNETEALLLERTLIKQHQPSFNIDLRDDKSWLYIAIDYRQKYPAVELVRRPTTTKQIKLFGPYVAASSIRSLFPFFKKTLGLKTCSQPADKPCFQAELGRCLGHDMQRSSHSLYLKQLKYFEQLLKGNVREVTELINKEMMLSAHNKDFEKAARLRDQLKALARLKAKQSVVSAQKESFDCYGLARSSQQAAIARLPIRKGVLLESDRFLLDRTRGLSNEEIIAGFLEQFVAEATDLPKKLFLPVKLKNLPSNKFTLAVPQRGKKSQLLKLANKAAESHLSQSVASWQRQEVRAKEGLKQLKQYLGLTKEPKRIEGYDISNIQGKEAVGSMVVLTNGLPDTKSYRKFRIQAPAQPNDVKMMAEVLFRRFTKNKDWPKPDLVMLDGGKGQLSTIMKVFKAGNVKIPLVALAKQEELLFLPNKKEPIKLGADEPGLLLLEALRDEAHRFGITYYRARHRKQAIKSAWDELPGVGPKLKKKLKNAFGSIRSLHQAKEQDIAEITGQAKAAEIKNYLS